MTADLQPFKIGRGRYFLAGVVVVVAVITFAQHYAVGPFLDDLVDRVLDGFDGLPVGGIVPDNAPKVRDVDDREVASDVAAIDLYHTQGAVLDQPQGIGTGQAQLRERGYLYLDLTIGSLCDPFYHSTFGRKQLTGVKGPVDAGELELDVVTLGNEFATAASTRAGF